MPDHKYPGPYVLSTNLNVQDAIYSCRTSGQDAINYICSDGNNNNGGGQRHINSLIAGVDNTAKDASGMPEQGVGYVASQDLVAACAGFNKWRSSQHKPGPHHDKTHQKP